MTAFYHITSYLCRGLRYAAWGSDTNVFQDVSPIVAVASSTVLTYADLKTVPLTPDKIIQVLNPLLKKGSSTLATKFRHFITSLSLDEVGHDEDVEREKYTLLGQLTEALSERDSALEQETYLDSIIALTNGLTESEQPTEVYFSRILAALGASHSRK